MARSTGRVRIPENVTSRHYDEARSILEDVLRDIEGVVGDEPKWVSCRLNQTDVDDPKPFFLGWVENYGLKNERIRVNRQDPGLFRFLDDVAADTYSNSLTNPTRLNKQDWQKTPPRPPRQTRPPILEELHLYLDGGYFKLPIEKFRLSIAIKAANRYAGTLNTGLTKDPGTALDKKMEEWGQRDSSRLVQWVEREFVLGGPAVK